MQIWRAAERENGALNNGHFFSQVGNTSVIDLFATEFDHNTTLVCEAFNPLVPMQRVRDQMQIIIHCRYCNYPYSLVPKKLIQISQR